MSSTAPAPSSSGWIVNSRFDLLFIFGSPFIIWPLLTYMQDVIGADTISSSTGLIVILATSHYFSTFARAYGDRQLVQRYRARMFLVPILIICGSIWAFRTNASGLLLVTALWGWWHWLAQGFGFARIYDGKIGSHAAITAFLDKALVVTWFFAAIMLNSNATSQFGALFADCGIRLPTGSTIALTRSITIAAVVAVTAAFIINFAYRWKSGQPVSWIKLSMLITTIGYYYFVAAYMPNVLIGYALFEMFHDIQYLAIVWIFSQKRVEKGEVSDWMGKLFRPRAMMVGLYLGIILLFGFADYSGRQMNAGFTKDVLGAVFLTAALMHYYLDGFIWKLRDSQTRRNLGIAGDEGTSSGLATALRHGITWSFFVIPVALFTYATPDQENMLPPAKRAEMFVEAFPDHFKSHLDLGLSLIQRGEFAAGIEHYRSAIAINPNFTQAYVNLGAALEVTGKFDEATKTLQKALSLSDRRGAHDDAKLRLGVTQWFTGHEQAARDQFAALSVDATIVTNHMIQVSNLLAQQRFETVKLLKLNTSIAKFAPTNAPIRMSLGRDYLQLKKPAEAARWYAEVIKLVPGAIDAWIGFGTAQAQAGQLGDAEKAFARVLQFDPNHKIARQQLDRLRRK